MNIIKMQRDAGCAAPTGSFWLSVSTISGPDSLLAPGHVHFLVGSL